jgi:diacylglycerol kinase
MMNNNKTMGITSRKNSFVYAFSGLVRIFREEPNAKLHAIATLAAIAAGIALHITPMEWIAIVVAIALVWITEALNTCIEKLCDFACDNKIHPAIKVIKDISAGAVLIAALASVAIGIIVFFF